MLISRHFIISLILAIVLFPVYKWLSLLVFVFGFLIDVDHYLWHVIISKNFSLRKAYNYSLDKNRDSSNEDVLHIFHVLEIWILVLLLGFINEIFFILALGLVAHLIMDFAECIKEGYYYARTFSLFTWIYRN